MIPVILMIPIYIFIYNFKGLYNNERIMFLNKEIGKIVISNVLGILIFTGILFISKQIDYSRSILVLFFLINIIIMSVERVIIRKFIRRIKKEGFNINILFLLDIVMEQRDLID